MMRVNDWSATRSGATMTVVGSDIDTGRSVRMTGVSYVGTNGGHQRVVAIRDRKVIAELVL